MTQASMSAVLLGMLACGAGCGAGNSTDKFIGTWVYSGGSIALECSSGTTQMPLTSAITETLSPGSAPDVLEKTDSNGCSGFKFEAAGALASAPPDQTCSFTQDGVTVTIEEASYFLTLSDDAETLTTAVKGTVRRSVEADSCAANGGGTLVRSDR